MMATWEVAKNDLEYALGIVLNVPAKSGMVSSEYIKVSRCETGAMLSLSADLTAEASLEYAFPFKKSLYLDRRLFDPFVSAGKELSGNTYTMTMKHEGVLQVKHGTRTGIFSVGKKVSGFATRPVYEKAQKMRVYESWTKIMQCAIACATNDPVVPQFNCVYVVPANKRDLMMYSTNTKVVFVGRGSTKKLPSKPIAFPLILASRLEGNDMENVTWDDKSALISSERGAMWEAVKSAARKKFPKDQLDKLVASIKKGKPLLTLAAEDISEAADRIAGYLTAVSREDLVLRIKTSKDDQSAKLISGTGETLFTEHIKLLKPAREDVELHWPLDEVMPALLFSKNQGTATIYQHEDTRSMYSTDDLSLVIAKREA